LTVAPTTTPLADPAAPSEARARALATVGEKYLAAFALLLIGVDKHLGAGVAGAFTLGGILSILMAPLWVPVLRQYRGARPLLLLGALTVASGLVLSELAKPEHTVGRGASLDDTMLMVNSLTGIAVVLWSRRTLSPAWLGFWYGLGLIASLAVSPDSAFSTNPWKYGAAVAVAVVALSFVNRPRWRSWQLAVLIVLALISVTSDSRSYFATFLLAGILVVWQGRPRVLSRRASWTWTAAMMGGLAVVIYYLGTTLLVGGYLGKAAQERTVAQIDTSGSLIIGGRPELAASIALFKHHPFGFGVGVAPTPTEVLQAKTGMADIHYDTNNNNYVDQFMFGGHFELHSTAADVWAHFGLIGLALIIYIAFLVLRGLAESISRRAASALLLFLSFWTLWNVLFSPFLSAAPTLVLAVGLALTARRTGARGSAGEQLHGAAESRDVQLTDIGPASGTEVGTTPLPRVP
jgi:hypothetical protein